MVSLLEVAENLCSDAVLTDPRVPEAFREAGPPPGPGARGGPGLGREWPRRRAEDLLHLPLISRGLPRARATRILSASQNPSKLRCLTAVRSSRPARVDRTAAKIIVRAPARVSAFVYFQRCSAAPVAPRRSRPRASSWLYLCIFCVVSQFPVSAPCCIPSMFPYRLSPPYILYSLPRTAPLPFTPSASDSLRQPLPAWVKSPGPAGRAKPGACFPSERLLFAHSGN